MTPYTKRQTRTITTTLIYGEKQLGKIQYLFIMVTLSKLGTVGEIPQPDKQHLQKTTVIMIPDVIKYGLRVAVQET